MGIRRVLSGLAVTALLVPAAAITAARLLDLPGGTWVRLVSFTPYATVLYLLALVLLVVAWVRGRGFWRGTARLLAAVALLGVLVHGYWASGPFLGTPAAQAAGGQSSTVMTLNLRFGGAGPAQVLEIARRKGAEVLVLQEVTPAALQGLEKAGVDRTFKHSAGRAAGGPAGTMVFAKGRITGVRPVPTQFGSYTMDVRLPGLAEEATGDAADEAGLRVRLVAAHPLPPIGDVDGWWADQRALRRAAQTLDGPTMVVGDLNATMDHQPMRELVGRGYADAATEATSWWQPTWPSSGMVTVFGVPVPPAVAIDHVLLGGGLAAVSTDSFAVEGTDHRGLTATVTR